MNCEFESQLSAYHDDELSPADREAVELHLARCAACRRATAELRETSALFTAQAPRLSEISRRRLHRNIERQQERGLVRLSWALSGVAAAVMVVGMVWLRSTEPVHRPPPLGGPNSYVSTASFDTPAEQYYLADATVRSEEW